MIDLAHGLPSGEPLSEYERRALDQLQTHAVERLPARQTVLRQGARHDTAYVVSAGWLAEHRTLRDGRRQILNIRLSGELIGVDGLARAHAIFSTTTLTEVEIVPISLDAFERLQQEAPRLGLIILIRTLRTEAMLRQWGVSLGRRRALERLAHLLLELHHRLCRYGLAQRGRFPLPLTQQELSDCLGMTTEHLNRMMRRLREEGLARMHEGELVIEDEEEMRRLAGFDPYYIDGGMAKVELRAPTETQHGALVGHETSPEGLAVGGAVGERLLPGLSLNPKGGRP